MKSKKKPVKKKKMKPAKSMEELMGKRMDEQREIEDDNINPEIMDVVKRLMARVGKR